MLSNKKLNIWCEISSLKLLFTGVQENPPSKKIKATEISFGYLPEHHSQILSLKAPLTLTKRHGDIKLVMTKEVPPFWLVLPVVKGTMQCAQRTMKSAIVFSCESYELKKK